MKAVGAHYQTLPVLTQTLRCRVCTICVNANSDGSCDVDTRHDCALFENIPRIDEAILQAGIVSLDEYTQALQESICAQCFHQHLDGSCKLREEDRCALFRYLGPVVDAMQHQAS